MMTYTVHEPPGAPADRIERAEALVFVRDGFSAFVAFLTPFWMLANRLWLALLGYLVAVMLLGALIGVLGVGQDIAGALMFAGHMIVGFEADAIRRWSLGRQGYSMIGSVNGRTTDELPPFSSLLPLHLPLPRLLFGAGATAGVSRLSVALASLGLSNPVILALAATVGIAALAVGLAQGAFEAARRYAGERRQFGHPISQFQAIQWKLADMATRISAARLLTYRAAWLKDTHSEGRSVTSSMAKLYSSEIAVRAAEESVQIHGGYGFVKDYPAEKYFRDVKLCTIGEGTSEVQRLVIARHLLGTSPRGDVAR